MKPSMKALPITAHCRIRQQGLTLVELMVAMAVSLLLLAALTAVFINSNSARREIDLSAEVMENGRYASDVLGRELAQTGFYGTLVAVPGNTLDLTKLCSSALADWTASLGVPVFGVLDTDAKPSCLASRKLGTDAIFVQRVSTCAVGEAGCAAESNNFAYLQVSECGTEYGATPSVLASGGSGSGTFTLQNKTCSATGTAPLRKLIRRLYYISADNQLSYQEIGLTTNPAPVVLVDGIEDLQISYGIDGNADGSIDEFKPAPTGTEWTNVIGLRVGVQALSSSPSRQAQPGTTDNLKRRVYNTFISFEAPTLKRQS